MLRRVVVPAEALETVIDAPARASAPLGWNASSLIRFPEAIANAQPADVVKYMQFISCHRNSGHFSLHRSSWSCNVELVDQRLQNLTLLR